MENVTSNTSARCQTSGQPAGWEFQARASVLDMVSCDMIHLIHPHWRKFPPMSLVWHYLLGVFYICLGITSIAGKLPWHYIR